ncbi:MAG: hypothetical protein KOO63_07030, partial [Bacteroidales bacterium]|nr:hypothetical protein [Candidatus Latescibacterota bacterium]
MKSLRLISCFLFIAVLLLSGCSRNDSELPGSNTMLVPDLGSTSIPWSAMMNGYLVSFEGRTYENDITTFLYTVSGEQAYDVLSYFFLEIPECAPQLASYFPVPAYTNTNPYIGVYGIKWESYLYVGETRSFMVSYPGDIPLGVITTSVGVGESIGVAEIAGPCKGFVDEFEVSGTVYIDADGDGIQDASDMSGISNVTITLMNGTGGTWTALTDAAGLFEFIVPSGSYALRIDPLTDEYDFNEDLAASFDATTPLSRFITIGPD